MSVSVSLIVFWGLSLGPASDLPKLRVRDLPRRPVEVPDLPRSPLEVPDLLRVGFVMIPVVGFWVENSEPGICQRSAPSPI